MLDQWQECGIDTLQSDVLTLFLEIFSLAFVQFNYLLQFVEDLLHA